MRISKRRIATIGVVVGCLGLAVPTSPGQESPRPERVEIPATATTLEGIPTVRVDSGRRRHDATGAPHPSEAAKSRLTVGLVDGRYYWTSRGNRPLEMSSSGEFTYLSFEPGQVHPVHTAQ